MRTIEWKDGRVNIIDQTRLPAELRIISCGDHERLARAIETMEIRGPLRSGLQRTPHWIPCSKNAGRDGGGVCWLTWMRAAERYEDQATSRLSGGSR